MPRKPKKWPTYALACLEDAVWQLRQVEDLTREAQGQLADGNSLAAMLAMSDVRTKAATAKDRLLQARSGEYQELREREPCS